MMRFEDREDVEEWLAPLDYEEFWSEVAFFAASGLDLPLPSRASCDRQIASGAVDRATVLAALKGMARLELVRRLRLPPRVPKLFETLH